MKAIQITFDEGLLETLDRDEEVQRNGRSAVIRRAVTDYLRKKHREAIAEAYQRGYGKHPTDSDFDGWAN
jgi:metal-responsive CopG/Arc/MetJ family transcriptional regulator